jgi:tetratricopeptide (TPR) repeat protein
MLHLNKNYDQAIKAYTEAIRLQPQFGEAYFERAYAYEKLGEKALAKADRRQAKVTANYFKETYTFGAGRASSIHTTNGTLYISTEGVKFVDKDDVNNIISFPCSEIIAIKTKTHFPFSKIYGTYGVEITTGRRKDAYLFRTDDDEQVVRLTQRTCRVGF